MRVCSTGILWLTVLTAAVACAFAEEPAITFDHSVYGKILKEHVSGGTVDYKSLAEGQVELDKYIGSLAKAQPATFKSDEERLAFWINAYNACVLKGIVSSWPLKDVEEAPGFFSLDAYRVAGGTYTLHQIYNTVLRKEFKDPRVNFALCRGTLWSPQLRNEVYAAEKLDKQLEDAAKKFIRDPRYVRIEKDQRLIYVSSLFKYVREDFAGRGEQLLDYIKKYLPSSDKEYLDENVSAIVFIPLDWNVNVKEPK